MTRTYDDDGQSRTAQLHDTATVARRSTPNTHIADDGRGTIQATIEAKRGVDTDGGNENQRICGTRQSIQPVRSLLTLPRMVAESATTSTPIIAQLCCWPAGSRQPADAISLKLLIGGHMRRAIRAEHSAPKVGESIDQTNTLIRRPHESALIRLRIQTSLDANEMSKLPPNREGQRKKAATAESARLGLLDRNTNNNNDHSRGVLRNINTKNTEQASSSSSRGMHAVPYRSLPSSRSSGRETRLGHAIQPSRVTWHLKKIPNNSVFCLVCFLLISGGQVKTELKLT